MLVAQKDVSTNVYTVVQTRDMGSFLAVVVSSIREGYKGTISFS